jgi:anti-anti-sigma regulatory factor
MDDRGATLHLKLEGKLAGAWVAELEQVWRERAARSPYQALVVDLTATEFVDLAGKYLLTLMHQSGVKLAAASPYMSALIDEIAAMDAAVEGRPVSRRPQGAKS